MPETLSYLDCPYGTGRKVKMWKIGMSRAHRPVRRLQSEFTETLCSYHPNPTEIMIKRVRNGPDAEAHVTRLVSELASELKIASLCVTNSFNKKEIYFLTEDEIQTLMDKIPGVYSSWTRELREIEDGMYYLEKFMDGTFKDFILCKGNTDYACSNVKTRVDLLLSIHSTLCSCVCNYNGRLRWIGGGMSDQRCYTISDFKWDIKHGYLKLVQLE